MRFSENFQNLIADEDKRRSLLEGCSFGGTFLAWEEGKQFISTAIDSDGTFLDVGCGNGFLLR